MSQLVTVPLARQRPTEDPFEIYKRGQAARARSRLYPLTLFYTLYVILVLIIAFSTRHPWSGVAFFSMGCVTWTLVEYLFHGRFPPRNSPALRASVPQTAVSIVWRKR